MAGQFFEEQVTDFAQTVSRLPEWQQGVQITQTANCIPSAWGYHLDLFGCWRCRRGSLPSAFFKKFARSLVQPQESGPPI